MNKPERIFLIELGDEIVWCDDPDPGTDMDKADAVEYIRKDCLDFNPDWDLVKASQAALKDNLVLLQKYKIALHDAINRPKGVIPISAEDLY